jgi:hypothetical protein
MVRLSGQMLKYFPTSFLRLQLVLTVRVHISEKIMSAFVITTRQLVKGIVSRVWGGLLMGWLNRTEVQNIAV